MQLAAHIRQSWRDLGAAGGARRHGAFLLPSRCSCGFGRCVELLVPGRGVSEMGLGKVVMGREIGNGTSMAVSLRGRVTRGLPLPRRDGSGCGSASRSCCGDDSCGGNECNVDSSFAWIMGCSQLPYPNFFPVRTSLKSGSAINDCRNTKDAEISVMSSFQRATSFNVELACW